MHYSCIAAFRAQGAAAEVQGQTVLLAADLALDAPAPPRTPPDPRVARPADDRIAREADARTPFKVPI